MSLEDIPPTIELTFDPVKCSAENVLKEALEELFQLKCRAFCPFAHPSADPDGIQIVDIQMQTRRSGKVKISYWWITHNGCADHSHKDSAMSWVAFFIDEEREEVILEETESFCPSPE